MGHQVVGTEHLLLGILRQDEGLSVNILEQLNVSAEQVIQGIEKIVGRGPMGAEVKGYSARVKKVLELALYEARSQGMPAIDIDHLFLGLLKEGTGVAAKIMEGMGLNQDKVLAALSKTGKSGQGSAGAGRARKASSTPTLDSFGRDLTALAQQGKLDPVIGRSKEIERVLQILSRRTKNNPVLIGEPVSARQLLPRIGSADLC